ncbi:Uncharacterised protein [Flavobacterium hibernum]|nr:Uncharacterised protein [Flavobacterium hibernum]
MNKITKLRVNKEIKRSDELKVLTHGNFDY